MSWGDPQQPPYDPNNPYGQPQQQPQQPAYDPNNPYGQQPQQQPPMQMPPQTPGQQPQGGWATPQSYYGTGPGYTQPMDGSYPQQGYGQPEFPQYPVQPPKKNNGLFIGIVVGALVVVGGGIAAAVALTGNHGNSPSSSPTATVVAAAQITAPAGVQGLTKLSGSVADSAVSRMKSSLSSESEEYPDPVLGAYNDAGGADVTTILVDEAMDKLSAADQAQLKSSGNAAAIVDDIMSGAGVSDAVPETTGAGNGALSCGTKDEDDTTVTICVWYDVKTFGTLQYVDGTSPNDAAPAADAIRSAAES
ncbi:MAG TPA: hypothetical protein VH372_03210 [Actinospica sp.]|jgi:hypothetical protein|nr:hypothetical protein [Actinospica sp.]